MALGYPVWRRPDQPELIRHPEFGRPSGVRWRRVLVAESERELQGRLMVTTPRRTAVDLALDLPSPQALVSLDPMLRSAGFTREELAAALEGAVLFVASVRAASAWSGPTPGPSRLWSRTHAASSFVTACPGRW